MVSGLGRDSIRASQGRIKFADCSHFEGDSQRCPDCGVACNTEEVLLVFLWRLCQSAALVHQSFELQHLMLAMVPRRCAG